MDIEIVDVQDNNVVCGCCDIPSDICENCAFLPDETLDDGVLEEEDHDLTDTQIRQYDETVQCIVPSSGNDSIVVYLKSL